MATADSHGNPSKLDRAYSQIVSSHADFIKEFLGPGKFIEADIPENYVSVFRKLRSKDGLVNRVGKHHHSEEGSAVAEWKLDENAYEKALEVVENRDTPLPCCNHSGIDGDGEIVTCGADWCSASVPREEVEF